jgi:putative tricarboxylic transport membrane protein
MNPARRIDPAGLVAAALLAALAGLILFDMSGLQISSVYGLGPKAMPIMVAAGLGLLALGNLVLGLAGGFPARERAEAGPVLLILGGMAALIALIGIGGGFISATAILFWSTATAFGRRAHAIDLGIGLALALLAYLLFAKLLGLSLPMGPIERLI